MARKPVQPFAAFLGGTLVSPALAKVVYRGMVRACGQAPVIALPGRGLLPLESSYQLVKTKLTELADGRPLILICQSQGGLHGVRYAAETGSQVQRVITISTPHYGTSLAHWARFFPLVAGVRDMAPGPYIDAYGAYLAQVVPLLTSIFVEHDFIVPRRSSEVIGANNCCIGGRFNNHITELFSSDVANAVQTALGSRQPAA